MSPEYLHEIDYRGIDFGDFYDELPLWSAPFGLLLLDRVPLTSGLTILDVGAGTGFLTIELAQRCGPETKVIAVDPWTAGVRRLRRKLDYLGLRNVVVMEQDAASIDLPEASVDVVVSNLGVNNFENAAAVLRACFRTARPGASLFLTTNLVGHMNEFYEVYRATLIELDLRDRLPVLDEHVAHRGTLDTISGMLHAAGFTVVGRAADSFRMRFSDGSALLRHHLIRLGFIPGWKSIVPVDQLERTFDTLERNLNALARERGEIVLTIPIASFEARKPIASDRRSHRAADDPHPAVRPT